MGLLKKLAIAGVFFVGLSSSVLAEDKSNPYNCGEPETVITGSSKSIFLSSLDGDCIIDKVEIYKNSKDDAEHLEYKNKDGILSRYYLLGWEDYLKNFGEYFCKKENCALIDERADMLDVQEIFLFELKKKRGIN